MAQTELAGLAFSETDQPSFGDILQIFSNSINEEQAWAVCFQCANYLLSKKDSEHIQSHFEDLVRYEARAIRIKKDGEVVIDTSDFMKTSSSNSSGKWPPTSDDRSPPTVKRINVIGEAKIIQALGLTIYQALDYGLIEAEERHLSPDLESLIAYMTNPEYDTKDDSELQNADDEGIENDADESFMRPQPTLTEVVTLCRRHLSKQQDANHHYKAVCRALVAEAQELLTFLDKVSTGRRKLEHTEDLDLIQLQRSDWARLWVQIMRELRHGVHLKKVQHHLLAPIEYELTPFEVLLEDIRTRRYTLNKIMVNGDIPQKVKSDAHAVILDFIRSRPPLHPVKDRVLKSLPQRPQFPREKLMEQIKQKQNLKPVRDGKLVLQTSKTSLLVDEDDSPPPQQKVIKVNLDLLLKDSFDQYEDHSLSSVESESEGQLQPYIHLSDTVENEEFWQKTVVNDAVTEKRSCKLKRRHTIMVCESPDDDKVSFLPAQQELPVLSHKQHDNEKRTQTEQTPSRKHGVCAKSKHSSHLKLHGMNTKRRLSSDMPVCPHGGNSVLPKSHVKACAVHSPHSPCSHQTIMTKSSSSNNLPGLSAIPEDASDSSILEATNLADISGLSELNATQLLHVSWKSDCPRAGSGHSAHCLDCRPIPKRWQNPLECLSLTLEELSHIRSVLTKAELESLVMQKELYNLLMKNKICFSCKLMKFSMFGQWGTKCKLCKRSVCSSCLRKMHIPTEHFGKIPVYTLSPIPLSQELVDLKKACESTGSVPPTPTAERKEQKWVEPSRSVKRRPLQRSHTISGGPPPQLPVNKSIFKGSQMAICVECKSMILEIIRASRTSVALVNKEQEVPEQSQEPEKPSLSRSLLSLNFLGKKKFNPFA